jgi:hypothetical protein
VASAIKGWDKVRSLQTTYPPLTMQHDIAQPGDQLDTIAQEYFGNANESSLLALNNHFSPGEGARIMPGQNLDIPQYIPMTNNVKNCLPYINFMSIMVGRLDPFVSVEQHTNFLETMVEMVAVVVAIAAAPYLTAALLGVTSAGLLGMGIAGMAAVSAVAAMSAGLIDAIGQGVLVAGGLEHQFNPGDVFDAALSAGLSAQGGITGGLQLSKNAVLRAILTAGAVNVTAQLIELAAGRITHLQLTQVLTSMAGAGLGAKIFPGIGKTTMSVSQTAKNAAQSMMNGFIDGAIEGRSVNIQSIFQNFLQSEAESALTAGREALEKADWKQAASPSLGKIPAPDDTGSAWKNAGNKAISAKASGGRWENAGSAAISQKTRATNFMLNQMHQAAAQSGDFVTGDDLFKLYLAHQRAYQDLNSAAAAAVATTTSVNSSRGFLASAAHDLSVFANGVSNAAQNVMWDIGHPQSLMQYLSEPSPMLNYVTSSTAFKMFDQAVHTDADFVSNFDPFALVGKGMIEFESGFNPITGAQSSHLDAELNIGFGMLPAAVGLVERADLPGLIKSGWGRFFGDADSSDASERFTEILSNASKAEARQILRSGKHPLTSEQAKKVLDYLKKGAADSISLKISKTTGEVRLSSERSGRVYGYQRMTYGIDSEGNTNKVVQTAFDDQNQLVRQNSGAAKNNLYDVKKWWELK